MQQVFSLRRIFLQIGILVASNIIITAITLLVVYNRSISLHEEILADIVQRQKALVNTLYERGMDKGEIIAFLNQVTQKHSSIGKEGEFTIAYLQNDSAKYLVSQGKNINFKIEDPQYKLRPMRFALSGNSGFIKGIDYWGIPVYAGYTYLPNLKWGIVAKIPVKEINHPYYVAFLIALAISVLLISIWIFVFVKISSPLYNKMKESEETYRMLYESINDAIFISELRQNGKPGKFIQVNNIACQRLGYTREELIGKSIMEINSERIRSKIPEILRQLKENKRVIAEMEHVTKDGKIIPVEISSRLTQFRDKTIIHSIARDISQRKRIEADLRQSNALLRNTQSMAKTGGWEWDLENNIMYWTEETYRIHGFEPSEITPDAEAHIAKSQECYPPEDRILVMEAFNRCVKQGIPYDLEFPFTNVKGVRLWIRTSAQAERKGDKIVKVIGNISDITDQKKVELLLKEKSDEIEAQNEEYKKINIELFNAKARAEESDRLKTAFLQNMSHEIRTPMNAIMGFSELMTECFDNKDKLERYSRIINQRSSDLLDIINEILDIAKIESGQLTTSLEECDLNALFSELSLFFKEHKTKLNKENLEFKVDLQYTSDSPVIITDKIKLKQIFINLIGNAFKFTDLGSIKAGCNLDEQNNLIFYVSDTGIGIPADKKESVFERFVQVKHENNKVYGGTGLGLSIVKGLIDLLDGKIWLESELNKGTTFFFTVSYKMKKESEKQNNDIQNKIHYDFSGKKALIVEDDLCNAELLKDILTSSGFAIACVSLGQEAVDLALSQTFDIVLMDIGLPDISGYDATQQIKQQKPSLKIIAQTAYAAQADRQNAIDAGCIDYLSKPLNKNDLLTMLYKYLH
jgi:PAS domain S-box-containing protein